MDGLIEVTEAQAWGIALACVMMCADVIVGFVGAVANNEVSSKKMRQGLLHKVMVLVLVFASLAVEVGVGHMVELPYDVPTCEVVCGYVVVMELSSVLENIGKGYPCFADSALFRLFDIAGKEPDDGD